MLLPVEGFEGMHERTDMAQVGSADSPLTMQRLIAYMFGKAVVEEDGSCCNGLL